LKIEKPDDPNKVTLAGEKATWSSTGNREKILKENEVPVSYNILRNKNTCKHQEIQQENPTTKKNPINARF
jgi:hypothetical protein